jgi:hypothetical protein
MAEVVHPPDDPEHPSPDENGFEPYLRMPTFEDIALSMDLPAAAGFFAHCDRDEEFLTADLSEQARLRPYLAHQFVTNVGLRNNPSFSTILPYEMVDENIRNFQGRFGAQPPRDAHSRKQRAGYMHQQMQLLTPWVDADIRIRDTHHLAHELYIMGDPELSDGVDTLLTAIGVTLKTIIRPL